MKFTKEEAYKDLVEQLTAKGEKLNLSKRSIEEQLETLMSLVATDETELADFVKKTLPVFKTADANIRNDVSAGITEFKKSYKPEEKKEEVKKEKKGNEEEDAIAKLLKRIDDLENESKANKAKEVASNLRQSFVSKAKEKGVKDEEWLNSYADILSITDGFDADAQADSCLKFYNKSMSVIKKDVTPKFGGGKSDDKHIQSVIANAAALMKENGGAA